MERDRFIDRKFASASHFNSHAHVERDAIQLSHNEWTLNFNSHAHVERDDGEIQLRDQDGNFNSHAHVERDGAKLDDNAIIGISTHTLTWSVT